jgi:hypothetical protein
MMCLRRGIKEATRAHHLNNYADRNQKILIYDELKRKKANKQLLGVFLLFFFGGFWTFFHVLLPNVRGHKFGYWLRPVHTTEHV